MTTNKKPKTNTESATAVSARAQIDGPILLLEHTLEYFKGVGE